MPELFTPSPRADNAEGGQNKDLHAQLLENTRKYYGLYREAYENYVHDYLRENYQLMMLYDALLVARQKDATKLIRGTINIPKMQPELYARASQEAKILLGGKPIWKVNAPQNADRDTLNRHKTIEECINDKMNLDNWFWQWYSGRFWAMLAPYVVFQERHTVEYAYLPDKTYNAKTNRLNFEYRECFNGSRTRVWFPWEVFYDITNATLDAPIFKRFLVSEEEVAEKLSTKEWKIPAGKENETRSANTGLRNYGLEIIRSVPRKAGEGTEERRPLKDQHEVLECLNYIVGSDKKRVLVRWWVLNGAAVVKGPEVVQARRTANNHILCVARRIPGFSFGMPPADSAKQIQRATNRNYNQRDEAFLYGLVPPFIMGEGQKFVEDRPTIAPATGIRTTGDARNIQLLQSRVMPTEADAILGYLDIKGQLATNTNAPMIGQPTKQGTPLSAFESGQVAEGQGSVLGMFMLTEREFFVNWAAKKYWTMMENCPIKVEYSGRAYNLLEMIVGEPQFDMPQLGEAAGRTADKLQLQAFFSTVSQIFQTLGPIRKEVHPQMFALIEELALSMNLTRIDKILEPEQTKGVVEPTGPDEIEAALQEKDAMNRQALAAATSTQNGKKGAESGKKQEARV